MTHPLDTAPCGIFSFDRTGMLVSVNATLCRWLGLEPDEWVHQPVDYLLTLPSRIFYQTHLFPLLGLREEVTEIFLTLARKDSEPLPVLLSGRRDMQEGVTVYTCACITVHHRKQFEDELIAARHTAEQALKDNSALQQVTEELRLQAQQLDRQLSIVRRQHAEQTQMSRVVTHELQEPLRKILVFSQMMTERTATADEPAPAAGDKLLRATEQLRVVVGGLQQYVWLQETPVRPELLDIPDLLRLVKMKLAERSGTFEWELSVGPLPQIIGDRELMHLMLFQLLSNAVQFKKEGLPASISISATLLRKNQYRELPSRYQFEEFVQLEITDKGVGFDPKLQEAVFGLFNRVGHGQKRGIGLALCKTIAEKHGGGISIHSEPGRATTVTVLLPFMPAAALSRPTPPYRANL